MEQQIKMTDRKIVVPGEVIVSGDNYLPGEGTEKQGIDIVSMRYGLAEEIQDLVKVISISGPYLPRRGNVVIGTIENINFSGWFVDMQMPEYAFLPLSEVPMFINKSEIEEFMGIGSVVVAKIRDVNKKGIDLTIKGRGLGRIEDGIILHVNPHKVPRVIGKEGSMVNLIKEETDCNITVGQNGAISISGDKIESELLAKKAILFIVEKAYISGLTEEMKKWFEKEKKNGK